MTQSYNAGGAEGPTGPRAAVGVRLVAFLVDLIILGVVQVILWMFLGKALAQLLGLVLDIAYFSYFESQPAGQTLGKQVMGIRVIDITTGGPIDMSRALVRSVVRIVSGAACVIGYVWAFFNKETQTWHDLAAQTVVVPVSDYPV